MVATDLADHELWDWPEHIRARGQAYLKHVAGPEKGVGFRIARTLRGSRVEARTISATTSVPIWSGRSTWSRAAACCCTCATPCVL